MRHTLHASADGDSVYHWSGSVVVGRLMSALKKPRNVSYERGLLVKRRVTVWGTRESLRSNIGVCKPVYCIACSRAVLDISALDQSC